MIRRTLVAVLVIAVLPATSWAADDPETIRMMAKYKPNIDKALQWIAKQQLRDGRWEVTGGPYPYPVAMTALAGMALLAEGSTPTQGKYARELDNAVEYLINKAQKNGLIGNASDERDKHRYMYGHGFSMMFLAQVYGEETDLSRRRDLERVLTRAVEFTAKAQTRVGGFGYVSAADGSDFDEGSVTITQVQALRAARNSGVSVPKKVIDDALEYLRKSTVAAPGSNDSDPKKRKAGVIYSLKQGGNGIRVPLTAAGIACSFNSGEYKSELALQWLNFCTEMIHIDATRSSYGHYEYTHYYYAQVVYTLGEDGHAKLRPDLPEDKLVKWSKYRAALFEHLCSGQNPDGSWSRGSGFSSVGPIYSTALYLTIMQLDKANLPIYQR